MADVMEERGQHHFIVEALGHGQFGGLGHVLDLGDRLADVVVGAVAFVESESGMDDLFGVGIAHLQN